MAPKINLLNQRFGKLTVIEETDKRKNKSVVWKCLCDCGNIAEFSTKELRNDGIQMCPNCGHDRQPITNRIESIIGKKFNHLTVIAKSDRQAGGKPLYVCQCDCGNPKLMYVTRSDLISNHTKSCGCIKRKYNTGDIVNNILILKPLGAKPDQKDRYFYQCKCLFCGRVYESTAPTLDKVFSCGCQKSIGEFEIIQLLNNNNIAYEKEYKLPDTPYRFDFALLDKDNNVYRLIEFDGEQHFLKNVNNTGWNTIEKYDYTKQCDEAKNALAMDNDIPLVRIPYTERGHITLDLIFGDKYLVQHVEKID